MGYLTEVELPQYAPGVTANIADVNRASAIIDGYLKRTLELTSYTERINLTNNKGHLTYAPITELTTVKARYGIKQALDDPYSNGIWPPYTGSLFGPPLFIDVDKTLVDIDPRNGQVWLPSGYYAVSYESAEIEYKAGYDATNMPDQVKQICGLLVIALIRRDNNPGVQSERIDNDLQTQYFEATLLTPDMKNVLNSYKAIFFR